ncbi:MAG TPA: substrate-binding domain-containing protein [Nitrospira sp.]|nr:substrate-binding domain-containing protein [Nitrospira sp.]
MGLKHQAEPTHHFQNHLKEMRVARGLSQGELAIRAGITRQAVCAIEAGKYLPTTAVALHLSSVLHCQIEDLFRLMSSGELVRGEFITGQRQESVARNARVKVVRVGERLIVKTVASLGDVLNYAVPADGLIANLPDEGRRSDKSPRPIEVQLLRDRRLIDQEIAVAGCDPAVFLAGEHLRRHTSTAAVIGWTMGSGAALDALKRGEVHVAGIHIVDSKSGESNLPYVKQHLKGYDVNVVTFANWEEGLVVRAGNPLGIRTISDLAARDVQLINREPRSGARVLLDQKLSAAGVASHHIKGYDRIASSHFHVARLVSEGQADAGIGIRSAANYYGLDFIPIQEARYDFVVPKAYLTSHPVLQRFFETIVTRQFRSEVEAIGGYNTKQTGTLHRLPS